MRAIDKGQETPANNRTVDQQRRGKAGPKHTLLRCETERDRELVKMLIGNEYVTKLEEEMATMVTVKGSAYMGRTESR